MMLSSPVRLQLLSPTRLWSAVVSGALAQLPPTPLKGSATIVFVIDMGPPLVAMFAPIDAWLPVTVLLTRSGAAMEEKIPPPKDSVGVLVTGVLSAIVLPLIA